MSAKRDGETQAAAAAAAGISERTGRRMQTADWQAVDQRPKRGHRTRVDPFAAVWEREVLPLLQAHPRLQASGLYPRQRPPRDLGHEQGVRHQITLELALGVIREPAIDQEPDAKESHQEERDVAQVELPENPHASRLG